MTRRRVVETITREVADCDVCEDRGSAFGSAKPCHMCGKDVCVKCSIYAMSKTESLPRETIYCRSCWDVGELYRHLIEVANKTRDKKVSGVELDWKAACLEALKQ